VTVVLLDYDQNIVSMTVETKGKFAIVYVDTECDRSQFDQNSLFARLKKISGWRKTKIINTLPEAKRERGYKVVLDSVSDGIISIDEDGVVTTINQIAREIFGTGQAIDLVGKNIDELDLPDTELQDCIKSKTIIRNTKNFTTEKGRFQYFSCCKPIKDSKDSVVGAVAIMKSVKEIEDLAQAVSQNYQISFNDIIGKSHGIKEAIALAHKIADTDSIVSIRGESGTGKELFARAIHLDSGRSGPFVPINCAAIPASLLESELFGYVEGTFTGAKKHVSGLFRDTCKPFKIIDKRVNCHQREGCINVVEEIVCPLFRFNCILLVAKMTFWVHRKGVPYFFPPWCNHYPDKLDAG